MELKKVKISSTNMETAPFDGIILHSSLRTRYDSSFDLDNVITNDVKGIMFSGDWHKRPLDFVECLKKVQENLIPIFIESKVSLEDFKFAIGLASYEKVNGIKMNKKTISLADKPMIVLMGSMLIDFYLSHTKYWIYSMEKNGTKLSAFEMAKGDDIDDSSNN